MPEQDWESKFDDIYLPAYLELHETIADYLNNQLKAFIRSTLAEQRKEIVDWLLVVLQDSPCVIARAENKNLKKGEPKLRCKRHSNKRCDRKKIN